jgi:hypothetical protein
MPKCSEIKITDGHLYVSFNLLAKKPHYFGVIYLLRSPSGKYWANYSTCRKKMEGL